MADMLLPEDLWGTLGLVHLDATDCLAFVARQDGSLLHVHAGLSKWLSGPPRDLGHLLESLFPDPRTRAALSSPTASDLEAVAVTSRGDPRPTRWRVRSVEHGGQVLRVAVGWDLTDRRRLEQWVRHQATLLAGLEEAVLVVGLDGRILHWGGGAEGLLGLSGPERLGRPFLDLFPREDEGRAVLQALGALRPSGGGPGTWADRLELVRADGAPLRCRIQGWPVLDALGDTEAFALRIARIPADPEAPQGEEASLRDPVLGALSRSAAALVVVDGEGLVQLWSRGAERIGGRSGPRCVGRRLFHEVLLTSDLGWAPFHAELVARGRLERRIQVHRPNGSVAQVEVEALPIPQGAVVLLRDQTEEASWCNELRFAKEGALPAVLTEGVASRLADFLAAFEPDRRELLRGVKDLLDLARLVQEGLTTEALQAHLQNMGLPRVERDLDQVLFEMGEGTWRLRRYVEALRLSQDPLSQAPRSLCLADEVDAVLDLYRHRLSGGLALEVGLEGLPPVRAVRGPLLRTLGYLLMAARESCARSDRETGTIRVAGQGLENRVLCVLEDDGEGYGLDVRASLADPDWLARRPGLGPLLLGLAQESARQAGATFEIEGAPGTGTRVTLGFPAARTAAAPWTQVMDALPSGSRRGPVLLVEEDDLARTALERRLSGHFDVFACGGFGEALPAVGEGRFAAAIVGFPRPEGFGLKAVTRLAETNPLLFRNTVIRVPAGLRHGTRDRLLESGAVLVPKDADDLLLVPLLHRLITDLFRR